jgi:hypothetical protein
MLYPSPPGTATPHLREGGLESPAVVAQANRAGTRHGEQACRRHNSLFIQITVNSLMTRR